MIEPNSAHELLAMLGKMIADERANVMELTHNRTYHSDPDIDRWIRREWNEFYLRVEPLRRQQEHILKQLAEIENMKPPKPMVVTVEEADRMGLPRCP
jgi:hypothetical protein